MIRFHQVSKRFGVVQAVDGVSLTINPGERVALIGTNGSGKTTLIRALCGLLRIDGRIEVFGTDVAKHPQLALRSLAYMPQLAPPLDAPVRELVRAFAALRGKTVAQVSARSQRLGLDLEAVAKTRVRDLSGGMKQKLLAALALASDAPVLVCDEPTANLDASARAAFFDEVNARPAPAILVLCSHRVEEVRHLVDRVIELQDGRVVEDGSLASVLSHLRAFRVDLSFRDAAAGDAETAQLEARGFQRVGSGHFQGRFAQTAKVELLGRLVSTYGDRLLDLSVTEAESLRDTNAAVAMMKGVSQ